MAGRWQPTASFAALKQRALLIERARAFFKARQILEVETPLLGQCTVTDPHIESFSASNGEFYLQSSPEYAMKRLLAAGSGAIFQISKAFRAAEQGKQHNPEFTLLEWYRPGFDHHDLMDEVDQFLVEVALLPPAQRMSYADLFQRHVDLDPLHCSDAALRQKLSEATAQAVDVTLSRDDCLQWLYTVSIEPALKHEPDPCFVYHFPASQASLARIHPEQPLMAERFELMIRGQEIANGFHELIDSDEQRSRFHLDQEQRRQKNQSVPVIDERLLAALNAGLPPCAGVALGLDRLLMQQLCASHIREVIAFDWGRA